MDVSANKNYVQRDIFSLVQLYFDVCFFSLMVPFRILWDSKSDQYLIVKYKIQTVICLGLHANILYHRVTDLTDIFSRYREKDSEYISNTFNFANNFVFVYFVVLFFKLVWFQGDNLLKFVAITTIRIKRATLICTFGKLLWISSFLAYGTIVCLRSPFYSFDLPNDAYNSNGTVYHNGYDKLTTLFAIKLSYWDIALTILKALSAIHAVTIFPVTHSLLFVLSFCVLGIAKNYRTELRLAVHRIDISTGLLAYRNLRKNITFINDVFGGPLFGFFLAVITYYSQVPDVLMGYLTDFPLGVIFLFIVLDMAIFVLAAEFHSQVQRISFEGFEDLSLKVLEYKRKFEVRSVSSTEYFQILESKLDLMEMKNEMSQQPIALSCRFFSITYGFLASVLSVIVTYSIIILQMRSAK
ncbi:unnamed protein product [Orchesella dallaii]|uniref:Gustatory receptor n=1 Tax=Orchesella dallaii TaxID=48710 RepID=A0ABP1QGN0_9HEXA